MIKHLPLALVLLSCGGPPASVRTPEQREADAAQAVLSLKASKFADAKTQSETALALDGRSSKAAAVHAIATYQAAGNAIYTDLSTILRSAEPLGAINHANGRAAWQKFADALAIVDRDLAVVAADPSFTLEVCLACWEHDWNHNGEIDDRDHRFLELEYDDKGQPPDENGYVDHEIPEGDPRRRPTFKFDVGDAEWARAMVNFQRAFVELVLAYKWDDLNKLFARDREVENEKIVIRVGDAARVRKARELILDGLAAAERCRAAYLAETDDDREWVPNPKQKNHPIPLPADDALYDTWQHVIVDVRALLASETALSLRQLGAIGDRDSSTLLPDAYLDLGAMLRDPKDIVFDLALMKQADNGEKDAKMKAAIEQVLKNLLGSGYIAPGTKKLMPSPLVDRLQAMKADLDKGGDTLERKLRYLLWLN